MKRIVFKIDNQLHIFRLGKTSNKKICADSKEKIVQSYVFSMKQYLYILEGGKELKEFFALANSNCIDCPMRDYGKCYTHKFTQARGFLSMLRSIAKEFGMWHNIQDLSKGVHNNVVDMCKDRYVRFGTYGEPVLHTIDLTTDIVDVAKTWTGYTHQWLRHQEFSGLFMASVHSERMEQKARDFGWRSFASVEDKVDSMVNCPASKEGGFKTSCDKCGLCSGTRGKSKKSIYILKH